MSLLPPYCPGYPFDIPEAGAGLLTYCALVYHLPLVIAFSVRQRVSFVWGGCMLLPRADLAGGKAGIMRAWSQVLCSIPTPSSGLYIHSISACRAGTRSGLHLHGRVL